MRIIHQGQFYVEVELDRGCVLFAMMAPWCPACRQMRPELEALEKLHPGTKFVEANADESPVLMKQHDVKLLPLVIIRWKGKVVHASEGLVATKILEGKIA